MTHMNMTRSEYRNTSHHTEIQKYIVSYRNTSYHTEVHRSIQKYRNASYRNTEMHRTEIQIYIPFVVTSDSEVDLKFVVTSEVDLLFRYIQISVIKGKFSVIKGWLEYLPPHRWPHWGPCRYVSRSLLGICNSRGRGSDCSPRPCSNSTRDFHYICTNHHLLIGNTWKYAKSYNIYTFPHINDIRFLILPSSLNVIELNVVELNVVELNVVELNVVELNVVELNVVELNVVEFDIVEFVQK
jgi:hypothetical protein